MNTEIEIVNAALAEIGNTAFIDDFAENAEEARVANAIFDHNRDRVLEDGGWKFATGRTTLAPIADLSRTNWSYVYALPPDFISIEAIVVEGAEFPPSEVRTEYEIESSDDGNSKVLLSNLDSIEIKYIRRIENVAVYPAKFTEALIILLASKFAAALEKDRKMSRDFDNQYRILVAEASARERNQAETQKLEPATPSLRARGGISAVGSTD